MVDITVTVVYDNNTYDTQLETAWGFSCLVQGAGKTVLFDTGGDGNILMRNMSKLHIDPGNIDGIVLSHEHDDHTGGLHEFLRKNSSATVFLLKSFTERFKSVIRKFGSPVFEVESPVKISENICLTGSLGTGSAIREQSLIVRSEKGVIVITGCAHPGIVRILHHVKELMKDDIFLVMGGFHLKDKSSNELLEIITHFRQMQVKHAAPCHCTGKQAIQYFRSEYQQDFIETGVGKIIRSAAISS